MKSFATQTALQNENSDYYKQTLTFDRDYNGYFLRTSSNAIDFKVLSKEEYFKFLAGDVHSVFPQFDPEKHYHDCPVYNTISDLMGQDTVPITLFEFKENSEKFYGVFLFENTSRGTLLKKLDFSSDEYIDLKGNFDLVSDFNAFRKSRAKIKKCGAKVRKRKGLLFYGPPGNGKTAQISQLSKFAEKEKFRVFFIDRNLSLRDLFQFKKLFDSEDSVFVMEELTERTNSHKSEELLSFMDGELSWDNSYVIATTNSPEELPWNVIDRPSRFKVKLEFPNPTPKEREIYLKHMNVEEKAIKETVELTEGMSLDYIKNIVLDSFLENKTIPELIKEQKEVRLKISNKFKTTKLGIC